MSLQSNAVSHWLGTNLEFALIMYSLSLNSEVTESCRVETYWYGTVLHNDMVYSTRNFSIHHKTLEICSALHLISKLLETKFCIFHNSCTVTTVEVQKFVVTRRSDPELQQNVVNFQWNSIEMAKQPTLYPHWQVMKTSWYQNVHCVWFFFHITGRLRGQSISHWLIPIMNSL